MNMMDHFCAVTFPWGKEPPNLDDIVKVARHAEKLGFYSVNLPLVNTIRKMGQGGPFAKFDNNYSLDALTLLPAMVMATEKIRVAVDSIPLFQLPPYGWAKYFASLDVISGGRIIVGMCLGFGDPAFNTVGLSQKHRGRVANEQVEVITRLWTEDNVTHDGEFYHLWDVSLDPKPVQKPYPPIWWGGGLKSLQRVARYGECLNPPWPTVDALRDEYIPQLKAESERRGSKIKMSGWFYTHITPDRTMSDDEIDAFFGDVMDLEIKVVPSQTSIAGSPEQCAAKIRARLDAGIDHMVLDLCGHGLFDSNTTLSQMDLFVEKVVPLLS